jgi:hypothetical protein
MESSFDGKGNGLQDLRKEVAPGNEIDIDRSPCLQIEHHLSQSGPLHHPPVSQMANRKVLAEAAAQAAMGEEDGSRSPLAYQRRLLSPMEVGAGHLD